MGEVVELEIPSRAEFLALARLIVAATASGAPLFPDDRIADLRLAVSEACTNAMEAQGTADPIRIRCRLEAERVEVEVIDTGGGFDPAELAGHPPVTDPSRLDHERGLGIPLMRVLTDEMDFLPSSNGTSVRMVLYAITPALTVVP